MNNYKSCFNLMNFPLMNKGAEQVHAQVALQSLSGQRNMLAISAMGMANFQEDKKRRKRRRKPARPQDTRKIISPNTMNLIWRMTRTTKVESGGLADFTDAERNKLLEYAIQQYYLGYDEGKYNVIYKNGEFTTMEITRDTSRSNTQGNEVGGGISVGKDSSVSVEGKNTDSATRGSGDSVRGTLDQTKRNEMLAAANKLTDMRQQVIWLLDNKARTILAPKPQGIHPAILTNVYIHIDSIAEFARGLARGEGSLAAMKANP